MHNRRCTGVWVRAKETKISGVVSYGLRRSGRSLLMLLLLLLLGLVIDQKLTVTRGRWLPWPGGWSSGGLHCNSLSMITVTLHRCLPTSTVISFIHDVRRPSPFTAQQTQSHTVNDSIMWCCQVTKKIYFVALLKQIFWYRTFHKVDFYTLLSTCNEVTYFCSQTCRYRRSLIMK